MLPSLSPAASALAINMLASVGVAPTESFQIHPANDNFEHNRVLAYNAAQFGANAPSEFLSNYAVRYKDPHQGDLITLREALAPEVMSSHSAFCQYPVWGLTDEYLAMDNPLDVRRGVGADFQTMRNTSHNLVTQKLPEIGLAIEVDEEEELLDDDWQQRKVARVLGVLDRTELRVSVALFAAVAAAVSKTWDGSAGKDPDQDIDTEVDALMIKPNNIWFGPSAWIKRRLALRAQNLLGQGNSSNLTLAELGELWGVTVRKPENRFANAAATTDKVFGSIVMLFSSFAGMSREDFSNLKTFTAPARNGQRRQVWVRQVGDKRWRIAVSTGKRLVALTSAIGAEIINVS